MTGVQAVIFGGGPAGAVAALNLARAGCRVVVFHREIGDSDTVGEILSPEACSTLTDLGVWQGIAPHARPLSGIWSAWGTKDVIARDGILHPLGHGYRVSPKRLSAEILRTAQQAGAMVVTAASETKISFSRRWQRWFVGTPSITYVSEFLVDATGRGGTLACRLGSRFVTADLTLAVVARLEPTDRRANAEDVLLLETSASGWWYSSTLASGELIIGWLCDAHTLRAGGGKRSLHKVWSSALGATGYTLCRSEAFRFGHLSVRSAACQRLDRPCGHRWLAIGDAAATIDPLSGTGISRAVQSGIRAGHAVSDALSGGDPSFHQYQEKTTSEWETERHVARSYYRMEQRWPDSPFWKRRSASPVVRCV